MLSHRARTHCLLYGTGMVILLWIVSGGMALAGTEQADVAIKGYDPVAYFTDGEAKKGSEDHTARWHDMTWHFTSEQHRQLFADDPQKYAPQYDGYCAWAMTEKRLAVTDPEVWKIVDGKLYLNCSREAYEKWRKDIPGHIEEANRNWAELKKQA